MVPTKPMVLRFGEVVLRVKCYHGGVAICKQSSIRFSGSRFVARQDKPELFKGGAATHSTGVRMWMRSNCIPTIKLKRMHDRNRQWAFDGGI